MNVRELELPESNLNVAVDAIIRQLDAVTDLNGRKCLQTVRAGIYKPTSNLAPHHSQLPACYIWHDSQRGIATQQDLLFTDIEGTVSLIFLLYDDGSDIDVNSDSVQAWRQRFVEYCVSKIQTPDARVNGQEGIIPEYPKWRFKSDNQIYPIDHSQAFRRIDSMYQLPPFFYASRVDLTVVAWGLSNSLEP